MPVTEAPPAASSTASRPLPQPTSSTDAAPSVAARISGKPGGGRRPCSLSRRRRQCSGPGRPRTGPGSRSSRSGTRRRRRRPSRRPAGSAPACRRPDRPPRRPSTTSALQASSAGRVPPRDELGEDGDRDLLLAQRAEVEPGRAADAGERRVVDPAVAQDVEDRRRPPGARDEPDVARRPSASAAWSVSSSPCPIAAITTASGAPATSRLTRQPTVGASSLSARAAGLSPTTARSGPATHGSSSTSTVPSDAHVVATTTSAPSGSSIALRPDPHQPRLAGCERAQRLADDHGLRARSSHPAGDGCRRPARAPGRRAASTPGGGRGRPSRARTARRRPRAARPGR